MNNQNLAALRSMIIYIDMFNIKTSEEMENAITYSGNQGSDDISLIMLQLEGRNGAFLITE